MTRDEFNQFCGDLPVTSHVVQWGNADVWKVGGKVFAICGWNDKNGHEAFTFKVTEMAFEVLRDQAGIRPAPYLASRGLKWLQVYDSPGLNDTDLRAHLITSYNLVIPNITKKKRKELGIVEI